MNITLSEFEIEYLYSILCNKFLVLENGIVGSTNVPDNWDIAEIEFVIKLISKLNPEWKTSVLDILNEWEEGIKETDLLLVNQGCLPDDYVSDKPSSKEVFKSYINGKLS